MHYIVKFDKSRIEDYLCIFDQDNSESVVCYCTQWNMTQEEIDEEVSEIQKAYYTSGDIAGASDQEVIDKYNEMTGANRGYVKASKKSKNSRDREIYEYLDECGGYIGYDDKIDSLVEDFGLSREDAEGYVWNHASGLDRLNGLR